MKKEAELGFFLYIKHGVQINLSRSQCLIVSQLLSECINGAVWWFDLTVSSSRGSIVSSR